jgi:hypothetical protein
VSLARRVASLEDGAPGPCPECGHDPAARARWVIRWPDEHPDEPELQTSEPCPLCGFQRDLALDWEDVDAPSVRAGGGGG